MTENQKMFLKIKGFRKRENDYGHEEWYLEKDQRGEIVIGENGTVIFHFYHECYQDLLSLDSICDTLDYYKRKLDEIELEG